MATEIILPKFGLNMEEGRIAEWLVKEGANVKQGEEIVSIETDKVVNSVEAESSGKLHRTVLEGETVSVGNVIGYILGPGESAPLSAASPETEILGKTISEADEPGERIVSPAARKLAADWRVDLESVEGTGPGGRITIEDVKTQAQSEPPGKPTIKLSGIRKSIADNMLAGSNTTAPVTLTTKADAGRMIEAREGYRRKGVDISYNDILIHILVQVLKAYPYMNAILENDSISACKDINIAVAVDTEWGLYVPVLHRADTLGLEEIHSRLTSLIIKVRNQDITNEDLKDGTFTITNLGMYSIGAFTPIINKPQIAILGIGSIARRPWVVDGSLATAPVFGLSMTFDHRAVDGAPAARFLSGLKEKIESYDR